MTKKGAACEIDVVTAVLLKIQAFWDVQPRWLENNNSILCGRRNCACRILIKNRQDVTSPKI
jgi:hypothetical protein